MSLPGTQPGETGVAMVVLELVLLLLAITAGGWLLSEGAETVAEKYGANFAGSIVLALVTTMPEYLFVYFAALRDKPEVALGSAIGACTLLVTLGYGSVILLSTCRLSRHPVPAIHLSHHTHLDAIFLLLTALVAFLLAWWGGSLNLFDAIVLTVLFAIYVVAHAQRALKTARDRDSAVSRNDMLKAGAMFVIGAVIIFLCADPFVDSMVKVAKIAGVSAMTIAIILSPIASEMPEKITAYMTVLRDGRLAEISIANFMGSKVNHNSLLLAVLVYVYRAGGHGDVTHVISIPFVAMTLLTVFAALNLMQRKLTHSAGWVFLALYAIIIYAAFHTGITPGTH